MVDMSIFVGIGGLIFASITAVGYFIRVGRNLEEKSEEIVKEKAFILDEYFLKTFSGISVKMLFRLIKMLENIPKQGKTISDILKSGLGEYVDTLLKMSSIEVDRMINSIGSAEIPPEILSFLRLKDEEKDQIISLSFLVFQLKEVVPEVFSNILDKMTKAIILGVLCGLTIGFLDFFISPNMASFLPLVELIILVSGVFYFYYGIYGIWTLRKFEKKLKQLKKETNIDNIAEIVMELSEYG
jgi:hypothetical protein